MLFGKVLGWGFVLPSVASDCLSWNKQCQASSLPEGVEEEKGVRRAAARKILTRSHTPVRGTCMSTGVQWALTREAARVHTHRHTHAHTRTHTDTRTQAHPQVSQNSKLSCQSTQLIGADLEWPPVISAFPIIF